MTRWGWARLAAWVAVVIVGSWGIWSVRSQNVRLEETRADVLCPLYGVFLQSDTPARRAALEGDELDRYIHAIEVIADGAATLGCPTTEPGG